MLTKRDYVFSWMDTPVQRINRVSPRGPLACSPCVVIPRVSALLLGKRAARAHVEKECQMSWRRSQGDGLATGHVRREEGNTWAIMLFLVSKFLLGLLISLFLTLPATEKTKQGTTD